LKINTLYKNFASKGNRIDMSTYLHGMKMFVYFLFILPALGCQTRKPQPPPTTGALLVQLETTGCRGYCPIYKISIRDNKEAEYEGIRFVTPDGVRKFTLSDEEFAGLQDQLKTTDLWKYPESFPVTIADAPGAVITVYDKDKSKVVRGSIERPAPIRALDDYIRAVAHHHGIQPESKDPNAIDPAIAKEILIQLKPEVNAGNWIQQFNKDTNQTLRLLQRTGAQNIWRVAYDPTVMPVKDLLLVLKVNGDVVSVQENKQVQERKN
jgi:hypothetical protein